MLVYYVLLQCCLECCLIAPVYFVSVLLSFIVFLFIFLVVSRLFILLVSLVSTKNSTFKLVTSNLQACKSRSMTLRAVTPVSHQSILNEELKGSPTSETHRNLLYFFLGSKYSRLCYDSSHQPQVAI